MTFQERFAFSLHQRGVIKKKARIFVGCSGGPDSVALFHLLRSLQPSWGFRLGLLHFHHGLRKTAADRDACFVSALGRRFKVPVVIGKSSIRARARANRESIEEAARYERYRFFLQAARKKRVRIIALGHQLEDQAETVLMRILKGTGLRGLAGIQYAMKMQRVLFVRPLLDFSREHILAYLRKNRIPFRTDRTNFSDRFLRNRLRQKVLPYLEKTVNPRVQEALARLPQIVGDELRVIEALEAQAIRKVILKKKRGAVILAKEFFEHLDPPIQFRVLNHALKILDSRSGLDYEAYRRLQGLFSKKRNRCSLPRNLDIVWDSRQMRIFKKTLGEGFLPFKLRKLRAHARLPAL
ncbi:MAG: tRNA lysidine(34) synthetase TilS [Candidatus Omnitrophota bacterium]